MTVVIPAHNAAATIDETLLSVRAQSVRRLEVLVVDDGSMDETPEIALRHAAADTRVRLIRQSNGGVAAARNRGIEEARGALVAPVDADDLWHAQKIERQLRALHAGGSRIGLVYTWFAVIDERSRVVGLGPSSEEEEEGAIFVELCRRGNIVGNGSSALMRRQAVLEAGGYDASLRARGGEGSEDYKLYLLIAERYGVAVVADFLTGYRRTASNMSSNMVRMLRAMDLVWGDLLGTRPELARAFHEARTGFLHWSLLSAAERRRTSDAVRFAAEMLRHDPRVGLVLLAELPAAAMAKFARRRARLLPSQRFDVGRSPDTIHALGGQGLDVGLTPDARDLDARLTRAARRRWA